MAATELPDIPPHKTSGGASSEFKLREAEFGDGYEQVVRDGIHHEREVWELEWTNEDQTDIDTLVAFFRARGGDEPFKWTPPGDVEKLWRVRTFSVKPTSSVSSTLRTSFKRWFGEEPV